MANPEVLRKPVAVERRAQELIRTPYVVPLFADEGDVSTLHRIIVHCDDKQRRSISRGPRVGKIFEPGNQTGALRYFVRHLTIVPLEFADEIERCTRAGVVTFGIESKRRPFGIASEEPGEPGTLTHTGGPISGDKPRTEIWICNHSLNCADSCPVVRLLESCVRQFEADSFVQVLSVVVRGLMHGICIVRHEMFVIFCGIGGAIH